jgi:hypothetical protein
VPDPVAIVMAMGIAAAEALAVLLVCTWPWRAAGPARFDAGWALGLGLGTFLGCWSLGIRPAWPLQQDLDRLLALVLPAIVAIEVLAAFPRVPRWLVWTLRLAVAAATARVLLHGTSYLTDLTGPGTREWSPAQAWLVLGGCGALLAAVWTLLALLARRVRGYSPAVCLMVATTASAVAVMLSGYATGGQVGLPLAAALVGVTAASLVLRRSPPLTGPPGVAVVALFSLLLVGRFFGELTSAHAVLLFCAPLLGWLPELPLLRRLPPWSRGLIRVILVGVLVFGVLASAYSKFVANSKAASPAATDEPSLKDYMDFGR